MTTDNKIQLDKHIEYSKKPKSIPKALLEYAKSSAHDQIDYALLISTVTNKPDELLLEKFLNASIKNLKLEDDPLAYLGILVDILEEWDRYSVSRESGIGGSFDSLPLQGCDVMLGISSDNKIVINYGAEQKKRAKKIIKDLTDCLEGWNELIEILAC